MPKAESASRAVNRLCDILNSFSEHERYHTLSEISRQIGLPKSTTHRFLEALESQGLLYNESGRGYRLGHQLIYWGALAQASIDLRNLAQPYLRTLAEETGETAILSMRFGSAAAWVETIESRHPVRLALRVGESLPLHAGASSKVLWAFLPPEEIERLLAQVELTPLEKNTITAPDAMRQELAAIRERGYATSFEETDRGAMGVAAPVYDHTGQLVAGIGIAAPITRVSPAHVPEIARQIFTAAGELSFRLGAPQQRQPASAN
ncbi:MAG TPA: IclR family transcriptional regulator [Anaerolineaceae bacterium]